LAQDATGTTTSQGIPTYATNVDAPSGKGFNAAMAVIDTLIVSALKTVIKHAGALIGTRRGINFIEGTNVTLSVVDDAVNDKVDVTINASGTDVSGTAVGGDLSGTVSNAQIVAGAVGNTELATDAVDASKIAAGAVGASEIADGSITDTEIAAANKDGAAGTASMRTLGAGAQQAAAGNDARLSDTRTPTDNTVSTAKLQSQAVTEAKLAIKKDSGKKVSITGGGTAVTFATPFTAIPVVIAGVMVGDPTANGGSGEPANYTSWVDQASITTTGFTIFHSQGGTRTVPWVAIGA
jgi:hypothetical protein